ncbi:hypothetical protein [Mycobacterium sp. IS-3022]|uniref:hypothetical protein n=1 Tax=Mycobacterium sp. IS-3022 TaxID=1772277 RepID=UPI0007416DF3|nr:hypothetical protein [Mycobacterium sp. IS-3022]KUH97231.1 hypothetical protein AU188_21180 [Mycobacterium sp. IS-3022]KUH97453.1 hypothetical protein AU188_22510 [Mycobacterium sp. IS-3022]
MFRALVGTTAVTAAVIVCCPPVSADDTLPRCAHHKTMINPAEPMGHEDCRLISTDRRGLAFDVTYWSTGGPSAPPLAVKIEVTDGSGTVTQTINEVTEPSDPAPVGLEDLDGDGREEIIVPIARRSYNSGSNTRFSVWRAEGDRAYFERTQMEGQAVYPSGDGYVVTNWGALTSRDLTFYVPTGAGFTVAVTLTLQAEDIDLHTGEVRTVSCRTHQQEGLGMIRMDIERAQDVFCASPAAMAIWPDAQRVSAAPWRPQ